MARVPPMVAARAAAKTQGEVASLKASAAPLLSCAEIPAPAPPRLYPSEEAVLDRLNDFRDDVRAYYTLRCAARLLRAKGGPRDDIERDLKILEAEESLRASRARFDSTVEAMLAQAGY